jgi:hypothetical protein
LGPLRERFLNARAAGPPPYPFYVAVQDMQVSPHEQIVRHRVKDLDFDRFDQMLPRTKKKWIIAAGRMAYGLIGEPGNPGENRIGLEARMPDGEYSCELLFGMLGNADEKRVSNWILYSWRQGDPFARAAKIQPLKKRFSGFRCFYLHLGKAQVRDNRFELSLQLSPHIDHKYLISHVKFIPLGMSDTTQRPKKSEEDTREELEKLKTLGYL